MCEFQGIFSKSAIVTLFDDTEVIILRSNERCSKDILTLHRWSLQLRDNEIDTTKTRTVLANTLLGDVVPISHGTVTNAMHAYISRFVRSSVDVADSLKVLPLALTHRHNESLSSTMRHPSLD